MVGGGQATTYQSGQQRDHIEFSGCVASGIPPDPCHNFPEGGEPDPARGRNALPLPCQPGPRLARPSRGRICMMTNGMTNQPSVHVIVPTHASGRFRTAVAVSVRPLRPTSSSCFSGARASFFFNDTATTEIYTLSLHDALPI